VTEDRISPFGSYYDGGPIIELKHNICVVGHRGARSDAVVRYLGALLGLHYVLLDDAVAHSLGESPLPFIAREGLKVYRQLEATTMRKLAKAKPYGIIACSSDALSGWWTRTNVKQLCQTVWLETDHRRLIDNARKDQRLYPGLPAYILPEVYEAHCSASWQGHNADVQLSVHTSTPSLIARDVMKCLGWSDVQAVR
jgi:shikimate kinase